MSHPAVPSPRSGALPRRIAQAGAVVLVALLGWQNVRILRHLEQIAEQQLLARRAELLDTIYTTDGEDRPRAPLRARQEAALALAEIERGRNRLADLSRADLRGADLRGAALRRANLRGTDLSGADLSGADLYGAYLRGTTLVGANLRDANLSRAYFEDADLQRADLGGAYLSEADLRGAAGLTEEQLRAARGDARTRLPEDWKPPAGWDP